jgi:O-antigen/teichoic acid export membrane protein
MLENISALKKGLVIAIGNSGKYLINTSWLALERVFRMMVALVVGIWVARYLGPEKFGLLNYAQSLVVLVGALATLGLDSIVTRALVKEPTKRNEILGTAFVLRLAGGALSIVVLTGIINSLATDVYTKVIIYIISSSILLQSFNVIDLHFQSIVSSKYVVFSNFFASFASSLVKVFLITVNASLEAFAFTAILDQLLIVLGMAYYFQKQNQSLFKWTFNKDLAVSYLRVSWPLILSGISISVGMRIDQVMIKSMIDDKHVGLYAVGVKLAEVLNFIPMVIAQSFFPKLVELDLKKQTWKLILMMRYIFYLLVFLALMVNATSFFVLDLLYGTEYNAARPVLDILIWTIPVIFLNIMTSSLLLKIGDNPSILARQISCTTINIILNLLLIPRYGIVGASVATLMAECSSLFFEFFRSRNKWILVLRFKAIFFFPQSSTLKET